MKIINDFSIITAARQLRVQAMEHPVSVSSKWAHAAVIIRPDTTE
jgi:hypothetical protein